MVDVQTCLASFAVAAGARNDSSVENVDRQIDAYLAASDADPAAALLALKAAFEGMRLDGQVASQIAERLDERLACVTHQASSNAREDNSSTIDA